MDWKSIMDDPMVVAAAAAVLGTVGVGLRQVWNALIRATVRSLDQVGVDDDEQETVRKVRNHNSLMRTVPAAVIIDQANLRRSMPPAGRGGLSTDDDTLPGRALGRRNHHGPQNGS